VDGSSRAYTAISAAGSIQQSCIETKNPGVKPGPEVSRRTSGRQTMQAINTDYLSKM
jgi:hypothetical protein